MRQVTLAEFLSQRLLGLDVETLFDRYEKANQLTTTQEIYQRFKSSAAYMHQINDYCQRLTPDHFKFNHIYFEGRIFF